MKVLVFLAVVSASVALPQSFLADTPEVQAEKQRFFQLYNAAAAAAAAAPDDNEITHQASHRSTFRAAPQPITTSSWQGPFAATIPAGVGGSFAQIQDTPEVLAARQAFQRAFQEQVRATAPQQTNTVFFSHPRSFTPSVPVQQKWTGPLAATIPAGLPGSTSQVRNTPEVEAAIAEFTRAYNDAVRITSPVLSRSSNFNNHIHSSSHHKHFPTASHHNHIQTPSHHFSPILSHGTPTVRHQPWTGPVAATIPAGLPGSGPVADTPDVAAAKASFQRAFQQQLSHVHG